MRDQASSAVRWRRLVDGSSASTSAVTAVSAVLCLTLIACTSDVSDSTDGTDGYSPFDHGGEARRYILHLPPGLPENAPLVFMLHGYTSDAASARMQTGFDEVADANGFAVAYPQGSEDRDGRSHWNARMSISDVDDIGFLSSLARHLQREHGLSTGNTFVAGFSNGGFMSYTLAMEASEVFRAAASVTGTMSGGAWENRADSTAGFPLLQISGTADRSIPIDGDLDAEGGWGGAPDMPTIIDYWSDANSCTESRTDSVNANAKLRVSSGCADGVEVRYLEVEGMEHEWPTVDNRAGLAGASFIWDFFSSFPVL